MIIFLYGPDTYRSKQKLNEIIGRYKKIHKSGLNLKHFDFKKDSFEDFRDAFKSFTMFKEKKLMVLENVLLNSKIENDFLKFLKELSKSKEIILIYEEEMDEKKSLFKHLKKENKSQKFELLEGNSLKNWVKKEFQKYSAQITSEALDLLLNFVGNDLWQMTNEIRKLVDYKGKSAFDKDTAGEGEIKSKDVELLVKPKIETDIFKTIDAIASKNKKEALSLVKKHLEKGDSPLYLLAMINFQFRNLLMIKDLAESPKFFNQNPISLRFKLSKELGMHPYLVGKTLLQARRFRLGELKKIYQKIFQADLNIKTGKMEPGAALETLLIEI
jgi:DNA polymerase-3 subunit delta